MSSKSRPSSHLHLRSTRLDTNTRMTSPSEGSLPSVPSRSSPSHHAPIPTPSAIPRWKPPTAVSYALTPSSKPNPSSSVSIITPAASSGGVTFDVPGAAPSTPSSLPFQASLILTEERKKRYEVEDDLRLERSRRETLESDVQRVRDQVQQLSSKLIKVQNDLSNGTDIVNKDNEQLQRRLETKLHDKQSHIVSLEQSLESDAILIAEQQATIHTLRADLADERRQRGKDMSQSKLQYDEERQLLLEKMNNLETINGNLTKALRQATETATEATSSQASLQSLQQLLQQKDQQIESLETEKNSLLLLLQSERVSASEVRESLISINGTSSDIEEKFSLLLNDLETTRRELHKVTHDLQRVRSERDALRISTQDMNVQAIAQAAQLVIASTSPVSSPQKMVVAETTERSPWMLPMLGGVTAAAAAGGFMVGLLRGKH